jgi:cytosine/creatinine deaminase
VKAGLDEGGCPAGSVLARGEQLVSKGRNQRVQCGDPIAHGEMDALRKAGRQKTYRDALMTRFIKEKPELWAEDIAED